MQADGACIIKCQTCRAMEWCGVWARVKVHAGYNGHLLYGRSYERIFRWVRVRGGRWSLFGLRVNTRRDPESMSRLTSGLTPLPNTGRAAIICSEPRVHAIKANVFTRRDLLHFKFTCCITIFMDRGPHLRSFSYIASSKATTAYDILPNFSKI